MEASLVGKGKKAGWLAGGLLALAVLAAALWHTMPLVRHLAQGIPYRYWVTPGYEFAPLVPGDHMQFLYWCWLMVDNLFGPTGLFQNPYEFNTSLSAGIPGFANFPFSLLYVLFYPLGQAAAYNAVTLLSYVLAGLFAYALAAEVLEDRLAAVPAGIIFALLPFRAAQVLSGHLFGFVAFMLPLTLWCLERGLKRGSWLWGSGAALCLVAVSWMEPHLIYYSSLFLGLYIPARMIMWHISAQPAKPGSSHPAAVALAGACLGLAAALLAARGTSGGMGAHTLLSMGLYTLFALSFWALGSGLASAFSTLDYSACRRILAGAMAPFAVTALYALYPWLGVAYLGKILFASAAAFGAACLIWPMRKSFRAPRMPAGLWRAAVPVGLGLAAAAGKQMMAKAAYYDSSIAGQGRGLREVLLFTPHLKDYLDPANVHMERILYFGLIPAGLALAGFLMLALGRPRGARQAPLAALWAFLGILAGLLCVGPTVPQAPLYEFLYHHLPFFNFPRVPGRLIIFAVLMFSLLAGWGLREMTRRLPDVKGLRAALAAILVAALAWDLAPATATGICLLPPPGKVERAVRREMPQGPGSPGRLLCLPIWPGDSHQSSAYELLISRTNAPMINGYSPVVHREYIEKVFQPLYPLDLGVVDKPVLEALAGQDVRLMVFYDDDQIYTRKVCPFPPALARRRLAASGAFIPLAHEGNKFLYRLSPSPKLNPGLASIASPVTTVWEAETHPMRSQRGRLSENKQASGWGHLFTEPAHPLAPLGPRRPGARGNVITAEAGRDNPGFLCFGPYKNFPAGDYRAVFRMKRGPGATPGWVDVSADRGQAVLARLELGAQVLPADGAWHDVALDFSLKAMRELEFRAFFNGGADLGLDVVLLSFRQQNGQTGFYRAQELWRQTGELTEDENAPGGLAVLLKPGYHPPIYAMYGPQATLEPGRYVARFRIALDGGAGEVDAEAADLVVALDQGQITLGHRLASSKQLSAHYQDLPVEFELKRRAEIGLRVRYLGKVGLRIAGAGLERLKD